jgi:hypothetical protein
MLMLYGELTALFLDHFGDPGMQEPDIQRASIKNISIDAL